MIALVPVPVSATVCGALSGSLLGMFSVAVRVPTADGSNVMTTSTLLPDVIVVLLGSVEIVKSPALLPVRARVPRIRSWPVSPLFVIVIVRWLVAPPSAARTEPKLTGGPLGRVRPETGATPVPVTVNVAERGPAARR